MKIIKLAAIIAAFAVFVLSCSNANQTVNSNNPPPGPQTANTTVAAPSPVDELASARATFSQACTACHQQNGEGGTVQLDKTMKPLKVPSLKAAHVTKHTDEQLAKQISEGGEGMPAFKKKLSPEQITDLVKFVRHDFQGGAPGPATAAPSGPAVPKGK